MGARCRLDNDAQHMICDLVVSRRSVSVGRCRGGFSFGAGIVHAERFTFGGDDDGVVEETVEAAIRKASIPLHSRA